jgi:hypothetical protein
MKTTASCSGKYGFLYFPAGQKNSARLPVAPSNSDDSQLAGQSCDMRPPSSSPLGSRRRSLRPEYGASFACKGIREFKAGFGTSKEATWFAIAAGRKFCQLSYRPANGMSASGRMIA